jgi:hypothetical protein
MKKIFEYIPVHYLWGITVPSFFCIGLLGWAIINFVMHEGWLPVVVGIVSFLVAYDNLIALCNPCKILIDDEKIEVYAFKRKHVYFWDSVERVNLYPSCSGKKIYLRLGKSSCLKGRYWIDMSLFASGEELVALLKEKEVQIHPLLSKFNRRSSVRK